MPGLARFHTAQAPVFDAALAELWAARKETHWMWFIFPQLASLGRSDRARFYGLAGLDEARAYLADPVLADRLTRAARAVLAHPGKTADEIMGPVDALKLRSCATLFDAAGGGAVFKALLDTFYDGEACPLTRAALG